MFIITVIPTSNIPRQETLTYFYKDAISVGALVEIPYNTKILKALVLSCVPISHVKADIKKEAFQLKKIKSVLLENKVTLPVMKGLMDFGSKVFLRPSTVFYDIYPSWYWYNTDTTVSKKISTKKTVEHVSIENITERFLRYKEEIKPGKIVWICVPYIRENSTLYKALTKEWPSTYFFHSKISEKKQQEQFSKIQNTNAGVCVISSPFYLGLALEKADVLIVDEYGDSAYRIHPPYYYDTKKLIEYVPNTLEKIIYGDYVPFLGFDTLAFKKLIQKNNTKKFTYTVYTKIAKRHNMLFVHPKIEEAFMTDLLQEKRILLICQNEEQKQKITCNDCKQPVTCMHCHSELYLRQSTQSPVLTCILCAKKYPLKMTCVSCGSWNLETLGLYKKNILEYIEKQYYTKDTKASVSVESFKKLHIYSADREWDALYVLSVDGYLSSIDFRQVERTYRLVTMLQTKASSIHIQTSFPAPNILTEFKTLTAREWFETEIQKRKTYHFPPFGVVYSLQVQSFSGLSYLAKIESALSKKGILFITPRVGLVLIYVSFAEESRYDTFLKRLQHKDIIITKDI